MIQSLYFHLHIIATCLFLTLITCAGGESSKCLMVYKEGGAPAVFKSPKCPRWKLSDYDSHPHRTASHCQTAVRQGRRKYQEDRVFCALDVRIPFPGANGLTEVSLGIAAVFDGHGGSEASDMASKLLLEYLILHTYFLLDATFVSVLKKSIGSLSDEKEMALSSQLFEGRGQRWNFFDRGRPRYILAEVFDEAFHLEILRESLLRTIDDIDAAFSKEAAKYGLDSGSTATIMLIVHDQILVANLGDSKALLCSERYQSPADARATLLRLYRQKRHHGGLLRFKDCEICKVEAFSGRTHLFVKELTRDHHPDREDEKSRVEMAGGHVLEWSGVPRVNGQLAISRAIGDVSFKRYGVTSTPEVTDWQPLTTNDSYLVAASDGVFEKLGSQEVCDLLWEVENDDPLDSHNSHASLSSLADCIVNTAYERGSTDNIAAVVVPLRSAGLQTSLSGRCADMDGVNCSRSQKFVDGQSAEEVPHSLVRLEHAHPIVAKFDRLLIEGKYGSIGYFYMYKNLKENEDQTFWAVENEMSYDVYDKRNALPGVLDSSCESSHLYDERNFCFHFGMISDGNEDHSRYLNSFASFLGLLESIPLPHTTSRFGSFEYVKPEARYVLKKRFGRGAYGEVWLAFHWNCSESNDVLNWSTKNRSTSRYYMHLDAEDGSSTKCSFGHDCHGCSSDDNLFILKRIMVERGPAVYLSGLREKYFGELFLNSSSSCEDFLFGMSSSFVHESEPGLDDPLGMDKEAALETESTENLEMRENETLVVVCEEGLNHIARYVESFESRSNEVWLVFRHEGISLTKLMYTTEEVENDADSSKSGHAQVLHPSNWWHWMKTTRAGQDEMRNLLWQLLMALKSCHERNITHRDIKPENMVICIEDQHTGGCLRTRPSDNINHVSKMRIIDFGSAIDDFTVKHLYGSTGPSRAEQTYEYTPPEALLNSTWYQGPASRTLKYDMWSVGVIILELILGSPDVFQISTLSRALLEKHIGGWDEGLKELAYRLRSFMEMCILLPGHSDKLHRTKNTCSHATVSPASWKCSEEFFSTFIKSRDPLKIGFPNVEALRLVRQLLVWDPDDRLSVDDALQHAYFQHLSR